MFPCRSLSIIALAFLSAVSALAEEVAVTPPRELLLEKEMDLPSTHLKANVLRVTFPQGFKTPLHTHDGPGPRYVLKGRVKIEEGGESHVYEPGQVFWETGQWMTAENVGQGEAVIVVIELVSPK
ncbi:MAG TPA: cupin domain-containing protein [Methylococcaceae bacterium]|nr:cupin domain-containing protein [Methylococcaceae bacterium]